MEESAVPPFILFMWTCWKASLSSLRMMLQKSVTVQGPCFSSAQVICQQPANKAVHLTRIIQQYLSSTPNRCYDELAAGGLVPRTLNELHEYTLGPQGSAQMLSRVSEIADGCCAGSLDRANH